MRKVLLMVDVPGWAWDHKADALIKNLKQFEIGKVYSGDNVNGTMLKRYDAIHSFCWMKAININLNGVTSGVSSYNHIFNGNVNFEEDVLNLSAVTATSKLLYSVLEQQVGDLPIYLCQNGVDEELFCPADKKERNKKITVGWIGQKSFGGFNERPLDIKGYEHILLPLREELDKHDDVSLVTLTNNYLKAKPHSEMPALYRKLDVLISTSFLEGTPNPAFEAAACGVPVISTRVGCIPELITNGENGIIVSDYKSAEEIEGKGIVDDFLKHILFLKDNRELCDIMGEKIRTTIEEDWTWKERAKAWIPVFENHDISEKRNECERKD